MSQSDDIKAYTDLMYKGPVYPYDSFIADYLIRNPIETDSTYLSSGVPDSDWDSNDTAGIGKKFKVGSFVQNILTGILYRCEDSTPTAAIWYIIPQEPF